MGFILTEEQQMLRDVVGRYVADRFPIAHRRKAQNPEGAFDRAAWQGMADELGILGASFDEDIGGLGGGGMEMLILMEEFGRGLALQPFLHTVVAAGGILKRWDSPLAAELISAIVAGHAILTIAHAEPQSRYIPWNVEARARGEGDSYRLDGHKAVVADAPWADWFIVSARTAGGPLDKDGISLFLVPRDAQGLSRRDYRLIDGGCASELLLEDVLVSADNRISDGSGYDILMPALDEATAAVCGEACGILRQMLELTIDHLRNRVQFGKPLSAFQVLRHRIVDMAVQVELACAASRQAATLLDDPAARSKAVSAAKIQVGEACRFVGENAVQLHGAMGVTDEAPISLYFRRALVIERSFGSSDYHLDRYHALLQAEARR
ncbi:acyl-CoA dehydrogenase family protein [Sphingomonas sp. SRS2]|uniref:acyl-CoA dehydrogenase family protein n=1 Tax=Sphingomonas sp. SRS2 TaxID=133190 RepID=UPI0006184011|nr:acyl-CoA dehydrogenase family protein [Sphingomonas sp. SRS2]KKC25209.1 hypothetical protein WP12_15135 [Sphingomonas sp. SRS2]